MTVRVPNPHWPSALHVFRARVAARAVSGLIRDGVPASLHELIDREGMTRVTAEDIEAVGRMISDSRIGDAWNSAFGSPMREPQLALKTWRDAADASRGDARRLAERAILTALLALERRMYGYGVGEHTQARLRETLDFIDEVAGVALDGKGGGAWLGELRHEEWRRRAGLVSKVWRLTEAPDLETVEAWALYYLEEMGVNEDWTPLLLHDRRG